MSSAPSQCRLFPTGSERDEGETWQWTCAGNVTEPGLLECLPQLLLRGQSRGDSGATEPQVKGGDGGDASGHGCREKETTSRLKQLRAVPQQIDTFFLGEIVDEVMEGHDIEPAIFQVADITAFSRHALGDSLTDEHVPHALDELLLKFEACHTQAWFLFPGVKRVFPVPGSDLKPRSRLDLLHEVTHHGFHQGLHEAR